jgi:hypothetical protein
MNQNPKSFIRSAFPRSAPLYDWIRSGRLGFKKPDIEKVFSDIYRNNSWANNESVSGRGSTMARTETIRRELPSLLKELGAKLLLDAACGDFNWMRHTDLTGIEYLGVDIVSQLIERNQQAHGASQINFLGADITRDELPRADVILCRDCLIHLSFEHGHAAIENLKRSQSTFLLATTYPTVTKNVGVASGGWRTINLELEPYNFPVPCRTIVENVDLGKNLGLWHLADL